MKKIFKHIVSIARESKNSARYFVTFNTSRLIRIFRKPVIPVDANGKILIHIGCGELNDSRYINVDSRPYKHIHYVGSVENFSKFFPKKYADLIYASHVIEHISYLKLPDLIKVFQERLKDGGILRISVPDFKAILKIYSETKNLENILPPLMGGQGYSDNFHRAVFDKEYLTRLLLDSGFKTVREWSAETAEYHSFDDWSVKTVPIAGKEWPISLNLEGMK